ncbi:MAG: VWA domain-containing protein [Clostridia bacterium]|nr:VWA domain-containing protein [Clostridia bacterium]
MKKSLKRIISLVLALIMVSGMLPMALLNASAATGVYNMVSFPRGGSGASQYTWGHPPIRLANGYSSDDTNYTNIYTMGGYSNVVYCIEPGVDSPWNPEVHPDRVYSSLSGDAIWQQVANNNGKINANQAKILISKILLYGFNSTDIISQWSNNDTRIAYARATQILIWEVVVGERDSSFNYVYPIGYDPVLSLVSTGHPLYNEIIQYYNSIVANVKSDGTLPSFCITNNSDDPTKLEYSNGYYQTTFSDANGVLSHYSVDNSSLPNGMEATISGNTLTIKTQRTYQDPVTIKLNGSFGTNSCITWVKDAWQKFIELDGMQVNDSSSLTGYITVECPHHHVFIPHQVPATCTEPGYTLWKCACGMASTNDPWNGTDSYIAEEGHDKVNSPWVTAVPETCIVEGQEVRLCSKCGDVIAVRGVEPSGHDNGVWKVDIEATPERDGQKTRYCTKCGDALETATFSYHTHTLGHTEIVRQPTCTENGLNGNFCSVCNACYTTEEIEKSGHTTADESVWVVTTTPTCTTPGEKTAYCANCGEKTATQQIEKAEHSEGEWITNIYAGCITEGEEIRVCDTCGETIDSRAIEPLGHDEGVWKVTKPATCIKDGEKTLSCTRCGKAIDSEVIDAEGHDDGVWRIDYDATSNHDGQKSRYCSKCDAVLESETFPLHNHTEGYRKVILEPTCIDDGEEAIFCAICGAKYDTAPVEAMGHEWSDIAKNNDSTHSKTCSRCHYVYTESCTFKDGKTKATCVTPGFTTHTCTQCGYSYKDTATESLGHNWSKWIDNKNGATHTRTCSRCHKTEKDVHVWTEWRIIEKSVIRRTTTYERKCDICGAIQRADKNFEIEHTLKKVEATPNTCTEDGNSEYYYCTDVDCGKYFSDENAEHELEKDSWIIPAHGHDYHLTIDNPPTCTEDGYKKWVCSWDSSHNYDKVIPSHGHNYNLKETVPSTCTEDGYDYYECTWDASHNYPEPIPAHGHDYHLKEDKCKEPTADVPGYNYYECSYDASHNYRKTVYKIGNMDSSKKAERNSDGTTTITLSATSDAETVQVNKSKPVDVVLVLDTSGSMADDNKIGELKRTATSFVNSVTENPDNRIAVISFGSNGYFHTIDKKDGEKVFETTSYKSNQWNPEYSTYTDKPYNCDFSDAMMSASANKDAICAIINGLKANGATRADFAFETAEQLIAQNSIEGRETVVLFITDGQPGINGFNTPIAERAIVAANTLKKDYGVTIYSVGFNLDSKDKEKMTKFMNFVSSNNPEAMSMTYGGETVSDKYYIYVSDADELNEMFKVFIETEIRPVKPFADITIFDTISKEFTMTVLQEQAFRQSVIEEYGVRNSDISVVVNSDGTTSITVRHLNPKTKNDANGNVIEYYVRISFDITANNKATGAQYYNTNTEAAGYMVGGMLVNSFKSPRVTVPDDRTIVVFLLGGRVYNLTEANIGDEIVVPQTSYAKWNIPEGYTVSQSYTEFEAEFTSTLRTVTWKLSDDNIIEESYYAGEPISVYQVESVEGKKFLGWDKEIPFAMPDRDLVFTAQYEEHTHKWSAEPVTQFGTCTEGITYVKACECGETFTYTSAPCSHSLTATITNVDELSYAVVRCENCNYVQEKYITYKAEYTEEDLNDPDQHTHATNQTIDLKMFDANDVSVQPDGTISIVIPATSQMLHDSNLRIYRINEDGTTEDVTFTKDNDRDAIIMVVDHFSYYVITASNAVEAQSTYKRVDCGLTEGHNYSLKTVAATCSQDGYTAYVCSHCGKALEKEIISATGHADNNGDGKCDECGKVVGEACKHMCHSTKWYIKIIWFIINLFNRLFRINQYCECGKAHY